VRGIYVAPFDELRGWDGMFVWDHLAYDPPVRGVADPWVALAGIAAATARIRLGPLVTPPSRRRVHKLARECTTLDLLSGGRLIFGAGLGGTRPAEFSDHGEEMDLRVRAGMLDDALGRLAAYWGGEHEPRPVQQPRIPIWLAGRYPNRRPVRRAARWDGLFPIDLPGPEALAEMRDELTRLRGTGAGPFDLVVTNPAGTDLRPWWEAGATWCLTGFGPDPRYDAVAEAIDAGPEG
jgi:alkanesulfonate monooxygenase SsuD/methylene tetrahydromethanopterin reductase-like flavin-dependent oxidoreductase (luciferase family)